MPHPIELITADPWGALGLVLGGPLHPGGTAATDALLDRAGVVQGTRLVDVGCGCGEALPRARRRGAMAIGVDRQPRGRGTIRGDLGCLPIRDSSVDVVLAECVLCLSRELPRAVSELDRVLVPGGRLALSDVVVDRELDDIPTPIAEMLCLNEPRDLATVVGLLEGSGFGVADVRDHRRDLLAMRDRVAGRVDYTGLLGAMGSRGKSMLEGIEAVEAAIETNRLRYISLVATK